MAGSVNEQMVHRFCDELTAHDPWMWRETCSHIRQEIDYSKPIHVAVSRRLTDTDIETYAIRATLKGGQSIEMHRAEDGWCIKYGEPCQGRS